MPQLHTLAYNLGNFLRTQATPGPVEDWSPISQRWKPINVGARIVSRDCYINLRTAEVSNTEYLLADILQLIAEL
jgi:hypothetical protein